MGGIYPHIAKLNHSCDPNCRFTYCDGRLDVWTCREVLAGQELTISYFVSDHFPGMPWDVTTTRQAQLEESFDFHCACNFCIEGFEGLESVLCGSCNGEIRPKAGVGNAQCAECDGTMDYGAVYSGALKLIAYLNGLEKRFATNSHSKIDLFNETVRLHDATAGLLHRHHIALFRMRALIVKVGADHECDGSLRKGGMVFPCCTAWNTLEQPMLAALNAMDATVVHLFGRADLMRNEILLLLDQISHRHPGAHDTEFRKHQWQIPSVEQVGLSDQMNRHHYEQIVLDEQAMMFFAETVRDPAVIVGAQVGWQTGKFGLDHLASHGIGQAECLVKSITSGSGTKMLLAEYIDYLRNDASAVRSNLLYLFQKYPDMPDPQAVDYFASAYQQPLPFQRDLYGDRGNKWLLIGPQGSGSALHTDFFHTSAWNALLTGHKWWCFFHPDVLESAIEDKPGRRSTPITWFSERLPELLADKSGPQPIQALQRPGETMWVPAGWHHIVLNLDTTVAVTENFLAPCDAPKAWETLVDVAPRTNSEEVMQESLHWVEAHFPEHASSLRKAMVMACANRLERQ